MSKPIEFTIESIYQATPLSSRIFHPPQDRIRDPHSIKGAVIAHPYAPLGGSYDDPIVNALTDVMLDAGYVVGTFNFRRGVWPSKHRTSWTSRPEQKDYISFASFFLLYLVEHAQALFNDSKILSSSGLGQISIVFGGYSYGSMVASNVSPIDDMSSLFLHDLCEPDRGRYEAQAQALVLDRMHDQSRAARIEQRLHQVPARISTSYLLISPIIPPITWGLAMKLGNLFAQSSGPQIKHLTQTRSLAVFGGKDVFASRERLLHWAKDLTSKPDSRFEYRAINDGGHFWIEPGALKSLREVVRAWTAEVTQLSV